MTELPAGHFYVTRKGTTAETLLVKPLMANVVCLRDAIKEKLGTDYTGNPANIAIYESDKAAEAMGAEDPLKNGNRYLWLSPIVPPPAQLSAEVKVAVAQEFERRQLDSQLSSVTRTEVWNTNLYRCRRALVMCGSADDCSIAVLHAQWNSNEKESAVSESWLKNARLVVDGTNYDLHDTSQTIIIGKRKPDWTFTPKGFLPKSAPSLLVELKARGGCDTDDAKGQAIDDLILLMDTHPLRLRAYLMLTDNTTAFFFRATREADGVVFSYTSPMNFLDGMGALQKLLMGGAFELGERCVSSDHHDVFGYVTRKLGKGASCEVYELQCANECCVLKIFSDETQLKRELTNITNLRTLLDDSSLHQLPEVVVQHQTVELICRPACAHFRRQYRLIQPAHLRKLLSFLEKVHLRGCVHRDVRFVNCFPNPANPTTDILLNDWGSATPKLVSTTYSGSPGEFRHPEIILADGGEYIPHPKHDLYSLVIAVIRWCLPNFDLENITSFPRMVNLANACKYNGLGDELCNFLRQAQ